MPQPKPAKPPLTKASVIALDSPARDQPVSLLIGCSSTASANSTPIPTQPRTAPAATRDQLRSTGREEPDPELFMRVDCPVCLPIRRVEHPEIDTSVRVAPGR